MTVESGYVVVTAPGRPAMSPSEGVLAGEPAATTGDGRRSHRRRRQRRKASLAVRVVRACAFVLVSAALALGLVVGVRSNHAYITTPSMYPTIPPGSMVFMNSEPTYHVGEVIEFRANGLLWIHRLIGIRPDGSLVTKGDNPQSTPDVFVPQTRMRDVIGTVALSVPYLGFPQLFVHHPRYALSWLRAELGLRGKLILVAVVGVLSLLLLRSRRGRVAVRRDV